MGRSGNGGVDLRKERPAPFVKSSVGASDPHRAETALSSAGAGRRAEMKTDSTKVSRKVNGEHKGEQNGKRIEQR